MKEQIKILRLYLDWIFTKRPKNETEKTNELNDSKSKTNLVEFFIRLAASEKRRKKRARAA